jgi:antitoxin CptB
MNNIADFKMKDISINNEELAPLRWACRRGMLELDLLFRGFLETGFLTLTPSERSLFKVLLSCTDPDLYAWLLQSQPPEDPRFLPLLKKIQAYGQASHSLKAL